MQFLRNAFFFGLVNILVLASVSVVASIISIALTGQPFALSGSTLGLLIMCALFGSIGSFVSLMISKWMAKRTFGIQIINPQTATGETRTLIDMVHRLARSANLPEMPEVGIYQSAEVNAFATGPSKSNSLVAVSTGLLNAMNWEEVEGVLGHEISHVANGDMVALALIQGVVNTFVLFFSRILASIIAGNGENRRSSGMEFLLSMALQMVFGLLGNMVVFYFSRRREFRADRGSANIAGKGKMISALQALQQQTNHVMPARQNEQFASFKISAGPVMSKLFSTHPPLAERIAALQNI
ncbi:MAG: protease HtpX [Bdellovibrionaceae bacterium]|nr:protease HtpX [Pseudobdellovibrionaceae bacterium]